MELHLSELTVRKMKEYVNKIHDFVKMIILFLQKKSMTKLGGELTKK